MKQEGSPSVSREPKFSLGKTVITPNALSRLTHEDVLLALCRHVMGDWGELEPEDLAENELSLREGSQLSRTALRAGLLLRLSGLLVVLLNGAAAQVVTENAGVQSPELPLLQEQIRILETKALTEVRATSQLVWSFTPSFETRLIIPTVFRDIDLKTPSGPVDGDLFGLGDVSLRLKYSLWQEDDVMSSTRWAALLEGTFPTGKHHDEIDDVEIPRKLQLGTGGFGAGIGTAFTVIRDRHRFSAELFYRHRTRHDDFRLGDSVNLNLAYWFRLSPAEFKQAEAETEVRAVFEVLTTFQDDNAGGQRAFGDGGGMEVWLAPGIQVYASPRVLFEASVQIPVVDTIDDALGDREWAASIAVKFIF